jgi:hypothetical protein
MPHKMKHPTLTCLHIQAISKHRGVSRREARENTSNTCHNKQHTMKELQKLGDIIEPIDRTS